MPTIPLLDLKIGLQDNYDDSKRIFPGIVKKTDYPLSMEHHLSNKYKETPEITPNDSPRDIINEIFENVPVSLGKQHFSPKPGFKVLRKY